MQDRPGRKRKERALERGALSHRRGGAGRGCGSGEAESFNETDWQVFTEETIEENAYEPITEAELSDWLETPAGGTEDGQAFDIVTEDAGTFFEEEEDDYYDDVEDVYLFDDEENEVTVIE